MSEHSRVYDLRSGFREQTYSLKVATLDDDTNELEVLIEGDDFALEQVTTLIGHCLANTPKPDDAEAPLAFDITVQRDERTPRTPNGG